MAAGFLAVTGEAEPTAAAERVRAATEGKLVCRVTEAQRVAELAVELRAGKGKRSGKAGKSSAGPSAKGGAAGPVSSATPAKLAIDAPATTGKVENSGGGDASSDDDDDDDDDDERAVIRANYASAVAKHGLPVARAPPGSGDCGGWSTITAPLKRPASATMSYSGAAKAANMAEKQEQAVSDKQRKNRRKAEKAREEAAKREALMVERREAARNAHQR